MNKLKDVRQVVLPAFHDSRGSLSYAESCKLIPFNVQRIFWIYDVQQGATRGGHAHRQCQEAIIALHGSFSLYLTDLEQETTITMDAPYKMVVVPNGIWCELKDFSADAVVLVATSEHFDQDDYLKPMRKFEEWKRAEMGNINPD